VAQSLGPIRVAIPDVTGQSQRAAELNVKRRGLELTSTAQVQMEGVREDQVVAQNPPANASQVAAPKISLLVTVAADPQAFVMANFVGQPLGSASRSLQDAGFRLGNVTVAVPQTSNPGEGSGEASTPPNTPPPQPTPASIIVSQNPAAGQKVVAGAVVGFEVR
jgi:eukaryotic-like serine/threonine-protein kinase